MWLSISAIVIGVVTFVAVYVVKSRQSAYEHSSGSSKSVAYTAPLFGERFAQGFNRSFRYRVVYGLALGGFLIAINFTHGAVQWVLIIVGLCLVAVLAITAFRLARAGR